MRDLDRRCILFAIVSPEDEVRIANIPYTRSIEVPGRVAPLASELNPALDRYYCCRLGKSDTPRHAKLIREPVIRCERDLFYKGFIKIYFINFFYKG